MKRHNMSQKGFSLIELIIVIVIIGILGSIAIPGYKDYVIRAKVIELFTLSEPTKLSVTEALMSSIPEAEINDKTLGVEKIQNKGRVKDINVDKGIITIIGNSKALNLPEDKSFKIVLTPKSE